MSPANPNVAASVRARLLNVAKVQRMPTCSASAPAIWRISRRTEIWWIE
jgi:hypothetical protein